MASLLKIPPEPPTERLKEDLVDLAGVVSRYPDKGIRVCPHECPRMGEVGW